MSKIVSQQRVGVSKRDVQWRTRGLSQVGQNVAEEGPLATVRGPLTNTQKKAKNDSVSECCGCLLAEKTKTFRKTQKNNNLV